MHLSSPELEAADPGPPGSRPFPGDPKLCAQGPGVGSGEDLTLDGDIGPFQKAQHASSSQSTSRGSSEQTPRRLPAAWSVFCAEGAGEGTPGPWPNAGKPSDVSTPSSCSILAGTPQSGSGQRVQVTRRLAGALVLGPHPLMCTCPWRTIPTCTSAYPGLTLKRV